MAVSWGLLLDIKYRGELSDWMPRCSMARGYNRN